MANYFISHGTSTIKEFNTLDEMLDFHKTMEMPAKHFCKLYDRVKKRIADGWDIQYDYSDKSKWRKW